MPILWVFAPLLKSRFFGVHVKRGGTKAPPYGSF